MLAPWLLLSFFGGSLGALLFNILAARELQPASYSLLTSIVFLFALAGVVATGLSTANTRAVSRVDLGLGGQSGVARWRGFGDLRMGVIVAGIVGATILLVSPLLGLALDAPLRYLIMAGCVAPAVVVAGVGYGRLYGLGFFRAAQIALLLENAVKLGLGLLVVMFSLGTLGFEGAYAAGPLAALLLALVLTASRRVPSTPVLSPAVWGTTLAMALLFIAVQVDIPLSRALFDPVTAGRYAAIATIAKALTGIALLGGQVLIRRAVEEGPVPAKASGTLRLALVYSSMVAVVLGVALAAAGGSVIGLLYGHQFVPTNLVVVAVALSSIPWAICTALLQVRLAHGPSARLITVLLIAAAMVVNCLIAGSWLGVPAFAASSGLVGVALVIALASGLADGPELGQAASALPPGAPESISRGTTG